MSSISNNKVQSQDIDSKITLNDGTEMPLFGLGTSKACGLNAEKSVRFALENGYNLVDTAQRYGNEQQVGKGLRQSKRKREDVFLVTKQWENGADMCQHDFYESLERLGTNYVDLFLIHSPLGMGKILETYDAMLKLKEEGYVRSVGVSNFNVHHLEGLRKAGRPSPAVNQIEIHPFQRKKQLVAYCREHNIAVMGYSPLAKASAMNYPPLVDMATKYKKTVAQVMIRWSVQNGYITIPKSTQCEHIEQNQQVFDWSLHSDDMHHIQTFPEMKVAWETEDTPWHG